MCQERETTRTKAEPPRLVEVEIELPDGEGLPALFAGPGGRAPAILLLPDILGRAPFYEDLAFTLANAGFNVLLPEIFFRQGPLAERSYEAAIGRRCEVRDRLLLSDLRAALDWLAAQDVVTGHRIGTIGFCFGGTLSLNLASARDDLATVSFYGFPRPPDLPLPDPAASPLDEVPGVHGPILGFWGAEDRAVGIDNVRVYDQALVAAGVPAEIVIVEELGHNFIGDGLFESAHPAHQAAVSCWARAVAFFERHLKSASAVTVGTKCSGYASCVYLAPEVFEFDDENDVARVLPGAINEELRPKVEQAVAECPMQAITLHG